jgi:glycerate kinase
MLSVPGVRELLREAEVELLCDVQVPLTGPTGAIRLFGPQKGASPAHVEVLEAEMLQWAAQMRAETGVDVLARPGAGAAGGLGAAFMAYARPVVYPGIQRVLDLCHFDQALAGASLVITGEGRSDRQTLQGKVPLGVLQRVRDGASSPGGAVSGLAASGKDAKPGQGAPVVLLSGRIDDARALQAAGFAQLIEVSPRTLPLPEALAPSTARSNLRAAIQHLVLD